MIPVSKECCGARERVGVHAGLRKQRGRGVRVRKIRDALQGILSGAKRCQVRVVEGWSGDELPREL
jgi:hypothetical protein